MYRLTTWMWLLVLSFGANAEIIAHDKTQASGLTVSQLRLIFSRQRLFWSDGSPIRVFILPPDSEQHRQFCTESLEVLPYVLQRQWDRLVYSGTADRPEIVANPDQMRRRVKETPGAIGYVPDDTTAKDTAHESH
ncbi:hypothetical protein [Shewanella litorisediminis]|uniref:PBP domain-containing protein n=1 Tax=Shewanella litorisediminis TaxID=1173586 RepID=A0ABX7G4Y9_9GAMM|nr:hypothetical protein [Shewanella litorisediminis]MCL2917903.1 substrate-binding domain-containing protein [Shewanella litorisediminis]QRH02338.1 hypothetical protein JQC75_02630 [Shewanella litorisediminis]